MSARPTPWPTSSRKPGLPARCCSTGAGRGAAFRRAVRAIECYAAGESVPSSAYAPRAHHRRQGPVAPPGPPGFARRRTMMIETINRTCDAVLGVFERVSQIARDYGIDPAIEDATSAPIMRSASPRHPLAVPCPAPTGRSR